MPESVEEQIEMDIIEKALDNHAKKYDVKGDKEITETKSTANLPVLAKIIPAKSKRHVFKNIIIIVKHCSSHPSTHFF